MRITRLQLRDFRRHRDLDLELAPGLTVVRGPNEAGKIDDPAGDRAGAHPPGDRPARATSTGFAPWDAGDEDRPWVRLEFEQDEDDGVQDGHAREGVPRREGHGQARATTARSITDPTLAPTRSSPS